jgi:2-dehydro-3-deoxyphosphogalactonate aldolase
MSRGVVRFREAAAAMPLVAILRGLETTRAEGVARALIDAGFCIIEIPLNRDSALEAIRIVSRMAPPSVAVGAGTVLTRMQARQAHDAGAQVLVMPHVDRGVIEEGRQLGVAVLPGVMTPTEAFEARALGVDALKLFPAETVGPAGLKALRSVLPSSEVPIYAVGGVAPDNMPRWQDAGADGFGIGSALFQPAFDEHEIASRARAFVAAWRTMKEAKK